MNRIQLVLYWIARILAALILLQTLFFKFTASPESVYIFTTVGMEPWGRIGVGVFELIASVLILISPTSWIGAGLALGLMVGAISMHLTKLGIVVQDDGGQLFLYACLVTVSSCYILWVNKEKIIRLLKK
jgi:uncharacterized membrane protein YphA (DoxX/SURF4 family)